MTQELIYTSAPQGLKPGSRGFCTVASTQGIPANLAERLESLSGYRQVFPPNDSNEALNPVVYSHLKLAIGGRRCHVLSRICAAGLDYTQRTNKFAHHVVLDPSELPPAGPAWLLAQPGFMESVWDGQTRVISAGRRPPVGHLQPAVCRAWQQITGDAGWAGVLVEAAVSDNRAGAVIIFRPGTSVLPLVAESLALLPPERRWEVTFNTYFTKLPPGIDCRWRFVIDGSPESAQCPPGAVVIELSQSLGKPPNNTWVEAARTGKPPISTKPALPAVVRVAGAIKADDAELERLLANDQTSAASRTRYKQPGDLPTDDLSASVVPPPMRLNDIIGSEYSNNTSVRRFNQKQRSKLVWIRTSIIAVLVLAIGFTAYILATHGTNKEIAQKTPDNVESKLTTEDRIKKQDSGTAIIGSGNAKPDLSQSDSDTHPKSDNGTVPGTHQNNPPAISHENLPASLPMSLPNNNTSQGSKALDHLERSLSPAAQTDKQEELRKIFESLPPGVDLQLTNDMHWYPLAPLRLPAKTDIQLHIYNGASDVSFSLSEEQQQDSDQHVWKITANKLLTEQTRMARS